MCPGSYTDQRQFSQLVWQRGNPGRRAPRTLSYEA
jgi:hypothetical protein